MLKVKSVEGGILPYALLETALYVADLERSEWFYRDLLGVTVKLREDRLRALVLADGRILLLFRRGASVEGEEFPGERARVTTGRAPFTSPLRPRILPFGRHG